MKILLADDHGLFRDSMAVWLKQYSGDVEVAFACDRDSLLQTLDASFDLLMLDLDMPGMAGAASVEQLCREHPGLPVLVVSANQEAQTIETCLRAGASGYITKAGSGKEILEAVSAVLAGHRWRPATLGEDSSTALTETLNRKQIRILSHLANGDSNRHIAEQMSLSEGTVKQYVSQLLRILDVDNRTQASIKARRILGISCS